MHPDVLLLGGNLPVSGQVSEPMVRKDYPIQPVPFNAVHVQSEFWTPRMETNRQATIWHAFRKCEQTGRIDNFAIAGGLMNGDFKGYIYNDSDVFKVIEGASFTLAMQPDPELNQYLDDLIVKIAAAQEPDGYLYTARRILSPEQLQKRPFVYAGDTRWSKLEDSHELYNVGHLYEAAVAHYHATGKKSLLDVATRNADLLCETFGPGKIEEPPGHQVIEIGLCQLYRATGQQKYLDLAKYFVELRGRADTHKLRGAYQQDHKPITEQDEAVGHVVRAVYYYSGVADVAALTGDDQLIAAIDRLWDNVVGRKMYLIGNAGHRSHREGFAPAYDLPNGHLAYNETCAAIAHVQWNHRMFLLNGDGKHLDVLERTLYNGLLSGVSLSGDLFFYVNPLESDGVTAFTGDKAERFPWVGTACCPVNIVRFMPALPGYIYAVRDNTAYVNLFIGGTGTLKLPSARVKLTQETRYPWNGTVKITVDPANTATFALNVRIPGWARNEVIPSDLYRYADSEEPEVKLAVNGEAVPVKLEKGFAVINREWKPGDTVTLDLAMPVRRVVSHAAVKENVDQYAVERGPLVYCAEGADNDGKVLGKVPMDVWFETQERPDLFGGIVTIKAEPQGLGDALTLIPYCFWANRGPNEMAVWFPLY